MAITRQEVDAMYMDLFGRSAKDAGAQYWMDEVASGKIEASDLPRHLRYAANTTEKGRADLAYGARLQEEAAAQAAAQAEQESALQATRDADASRQQEMISLLREQQASQLLAQQRLQEQLSMGIQGKGGTQQQQAQSVFGDAAPQPTAPPPTQESPMINDIDTGGGYYRNPYSSGFGMGYQDPYGGMRYTPQRGLMGPSGFGGKGGYNQPMPSPYGYSPYGGMSPGKGGYGQPTGQSDQDAVRAGNGGINPVIGPNGERLYDDAVDAPPASTMPAEQAPSVMDAAIASDGSNVVDFTPYAGDEFVRIGDQVVSRADLQRRGSDYYTRPVQAPPMMRQPMYPMYGGKGGYYR